MIPISIKAEIIADIADFPITNTLLASWLAMLVLIAVAFIFSKTLKEIPGKFQNAVETVVEAVLDFMSTIAGNRETAIKFFPIVATIFLFVLIANWMGILVLSVYFKIAAAKSNLFPCSVQPTLIWQ